MESCFPDYWKILFVWPKFENGRRSTAKFYHPVSLLYVVSQIFEKFVNMLTGHLKK